MSQKSSEKLERLVLLSRADRSAILEAGIELLADLSEEELVRLVRETLDTKRAGTPSGWRSLYWTALASEFGMEPDAFKFASNQPYGPRTFAGTSVVFLLPSSDGTENSTLVVHAFQNASLHSKTSNARTWSYSIDYSPFEGARETAEWIRTHSNSE